jgi:hypothetical protein
MNWLLKNIQEEAARLKNWKQGYQIQTQKNQKQKI